MRLRIRAGRALALACLASGLVASVGHAQSVPAGATPQIGQVSKDSVWVPTPERLIRRMLQMADLTERDKLVDLGSGDGRIPIHAAKHFGARAIGVELEENLIRVSNDAARAAGVAGRATFVRQDLFEADLSQVDVVSLYISPGVMTRLKPRLLALKPGTRVVSHQFTLGDWEPDETIVVEGRTGLLWLVPADVRGTWTVSVGDDRFTLRAGQTYQRLATEGERGGRPVVVIGGHLRGREITFSAFDREGNSRQFRGVVDGDTMRGEAVTEGGKPVAWEARRG